MDSCDSYPLVVSVELPGVERRAHTLGICTILPCHEEQTDLALLQNVEKSRDTPADVASGGRTGGIIMYVVLGY